MVDGQQRPYPQSGLPGMRTHACKPGGSDDWVYMAAMPRRLGLWLALIREVGGDELADDSNYSNFD